MMIPLMVDSKPPVSQVLSKKKIKQLLVLICSGMIKFNDTDGNSIAVDVNMVRFKQDCIVKSFTK